MTNEYLWLEVSNVRTGRPDETKDPAPSHGRHKPEAAAQGTSPEKLKAPIQVQLKGDRGDKELTWWTVTDETYDAKELFRALDTKRLVLAGITAGKNRELVVGSIRIQYHESGSR